MERWTIRRLTALLMLAALALAGCTAQRAPATGTSPVTQPLVAPAPAIPAQPTAAQAQSAEATKQAELKASYVGQMALEPKNGIPGTRVRATGKGLPANTAMQAVWNTAKGAWLLKGQWNDAFHGRDFKPVAIPLATGRTDASGNFETSFTVPEDWGFDHTVTLVEAESQVIRNQANFSVDMQMSISPTSGPPGTPITISARGIGYQYMVNSWVVLYDNKVTGWLSSVTTGGKATARIPAAGKPGVHVIQLIHGWSSVAYLNMQQSPQNDRPQFSFEFTITDGPVVLPPAAETQGLTAEAGSPPPGSGPALWTHPATGSIHQPFQLRGSGLPPGQEVELTWSRMVGSRVTSQGYVEGNVPLGKVVVSPDGSIAPDFKGIDDLGGPHRIAARSGGKVLASSVFTTTPSVYPLEPARGPAGTTVKVHLKGVGWTETANIYTLTYDNAYIGFACGFNSQGDVQIFLKATGEPGWHFIDLYPAIYKGKDIQGVQNFRYPMLTAEEDHPGERLPIFRLAFYVTA